MKKFFSTRVSDNAFSFAMLILRLGAGLIMVLNFGYPKLIAFTHKSAGFADPFGLGPTFSYALVVFAEFFCALLVILGLFTRFAAIPLVIAMGTAFAIAHKWNYAAGPGGGMNALLFFICFLTILLMGPGKISIDKFIGK
jgi:putative oxidoreductase